MFLGWCVLGTEGILSLEHNGTEIPTDGGLDANIYYYVHGAIGKCKGNLTDLRRILHLSLAKGNPKLIYKSK
jgi:hypothetical protein